MAFLIQDFNKRWPGGKIPYRVDAEIRSNRTSAHIVYEAIQNWNNYTDIELSELNPKENVRNYLQFELTLSKCQSPVGMQGGKQVVGCALTSGAFSVHESDDIDDNEFNRLVGVVMHEIGHSVGFKHEHQRPDRGAYINVKSSEYNYAIGEDYTIYTPYDVHSIMHYLPDGENMIALKGQPVHVKDSGMATGMGQRVGLSDYDIAGANSIYFDKYEMDIRYIAVDDLGTVYKALLNGRIFRYTDSEWTISDGRPHGVKHLAAAGDNLYQVIDGGKIWRNTHKGDPNYWTISDGRPHGVKHLAAAGDNLYQVIDGGKIWRNTHKGDPNYWGEADGRPHAVEALAATNERLFQVHGNGTLWSQSKSVWQRHGKIRGIQSIEAKGSQLFALINNKIIIRLWYE